MRLPAILAALLLAAALTAASADELIAAAEDSLTDTQREEPGSTARAEALAAVLEAAGALPDSDALAVRVRLAEAWLDGQRPDDAIAVAAAVQRHAAATDTVRERAALARIAAIRAMIRAGGHDAAVGALEALAADPAAGNRAAAHAEVARAELGLVLGEDRKAIDAPNALAALDRALALLADVPAPERVPVYLLRLTAMERGGATPAEVLAWLETRAGDPAAVEVAADATPADGGGWAGQPAPALRAPRLDAPGEIDLATRRGRPVLLVFFAAWSEPCGQIMPMLVRLGGEHPHVDLLGVSLDSPQTLPDLPAFLARHAVTFPIIGERLGWDGEVDDAWRIEAIPTIILVGADGAIAAHDLVTDTLEGTEERLAAALKALPRPAPKEAPFP